MTDKDKLILSEASSILRQESRDYYDKWNRLQDQEWHKNKAGEAFEKYKELNRIAAELDIIVEGL